MDFSTQEPVLFEKSVMFDKSKYCKVYKSGTDHPSGGLPHTHDYVQIWYITKGSCEHWVEGQKHLMTRGDIFIVPPKIEHRIIELKENERICCDFDFDHFFEKHDSSTYQKMQETAWNLSFSWLFLKDADEMRSQFSLHEQTSKKVHDVMQGMLDEYQKTEPYYEDFLRVKIMELLLLLAREYSSAPQGDSGAAVYDKYKPMVEEAIRYVDENYNKPLKLDDVCRISMVSKTYFCYLFKLITQQTLVEYIMNLRIQKATQLLKDPANSITWVGYEVGFNDSTHFSRTFKKIVGVSPRTYRAIKNTDAQPAP